MFSWMLSLLLALIAFALAAAYLWLVKRRHTEMTLGLQALAGMRWRDFSELVKRALREQRGLVEVADEEGQANTPRTDFVMADTQGQWLVSCKHGLAYRIGTAAINELGAAARLTGARGGILITEGRMERGGLATAAKQAVDVLDGPRLWPLLLPYLPGDIESGVRRTARHEAARRTMIAALAASTLGLLVGMGYQTTHAPSEAAPPREARAAPAGPKPVAAPTPAAPTPAATPIPAPAAAPATDAMDASGANDNENGPRALARQVAGVPGVVSAFWQTQQTLAVNRTGELEVVWPAICEHVLRYPALRNVRVQLNARPGVDEPVRWRQCAPY